VLSYRNITFRYPGSSRDVAVLSDVSFDVHPGDRVAILGANGSGKSTLARLANGLLLPDEGSVTVDGLCTSEASTIRELRQLVGMVFQRPDDQIVATTVEEDVAFGPENLGLDRDELRVRVDRSLAAVDMLGLETREPHTLSGGQKQRLAIAGAIAMRPAYLVLDEPTSMLDPQGRADVLSIIASLRDDERGVMHVTHDLGEVAGADKAIVLDRGHVVFSGLPEELLREERLLAACGLELPPMALLAIELERLGAPMPAGSQSVAAIQEALWG